MTISRRAVGLGLIGLSAAATGGYLLLKDDPHVVALFGEPTRLTGFVGGEKKAFLSNPAVVDALRGAGLVVDGRIAGSVEMVREPALLSQKPDFLWPSSSVMVELARAGGVAIRRDQVILNTPIVVYSWEDVADGLSAKGLAGRLSSGQRTIDLAAFLKAILSGADWSALGVPALFGKARIVSTDPGKSNSGFMFAGLVANLLTGDVATAGNLPGIADDLVALFRHMGYKTHSSGNLFEDYLAGGPGAQPMVVGYENQLVEWILADPERWKRVQAGSARPVALYPVPTVYSAHPLMALTPAADGLAAVLTSPEVQAIAWRDHGFRGPLGAIGSNAQDAVAGLLPERIDAVVPMPDAAAMTAVLDRLAA